MFSRAPVTFYVFTFVFSEYTNSRTTISSLYVEEEAFVNYAMS